MKPQLCALLMSAALFATAGPSHAHRTSASELSALSALPIAISVVAPAVLASGVVSFTVAAVEATADGSTVLLERASDGARFSVTFTASAAGGLSLASGAAVTVSAVAAGWVLSSAGKAIAFIPNEVGRALLHNERVSR